MWIGTGTCLNALLPYSTPSILCGQNGPWHSRHHLSAKVKGTAERSVHAANKLALTSCLQQLLQGILQHCHGGAHAGLRLPAGQHDALVLGLHGQGAAGQHAAEGHGSLDVQQGHGLVGLLLVEQLPHEHAKGVGINGLAD